MRVRILHVPDCPNASVLRARIDGLLAGRRDVTVEQRVVRNEADALACGMTGSPTLQVDGVDPFATTPVLPPSMSCRLYLDETGAVSGTPSEAQLRTVLRTVLVSARCSPHGTTPDTEPTHPDDDERPPTRPPTRPACGPADRCRDADGKARTFRNR